MNRRSLVAALPAVFLFGAPRVSASDLCDKDILNSISTAGLPVAETVEVFGCQPNHFQGYEYGVVKTSQMDYVYEAIGNEAMNLLASIDKMSMDTTFSYSLRFDRSVSEILTIGPYNRTSRKYVGDENIMFHDTWMNNIRRSFFENFESYALANRTQESELWAYLEWFIMRRDITLEVLSNSMNPLAASGFRDSYNYGYLPWPWHLVHAATMKSYLDELEDR